LSSFFSAQPVDPSSTRSSEAIVELRRWFTDGTFLESIETARKIIIAVFDQLLDAIEVKNGRRRA